MISQNIENSCSSIREYVKIELKFHGNFSYFDNGLTKNIFWTLKIIFEVISDRNRNQISLLISYSLAIFML